MNIRFIGSENGLITFKKLLNGKANVSNGADAKDALIFEISSLEVLYKIPKRNFGVPVFFYITTPNKSVISNIKEYRISGILFPPLNARRLRMQQLMKETMKLFALKLLQKLKIFLLCQLLLKN